MALDSDISNSDSHLHVEFYENDRKPYEGVPFVRIMIPGDKTTEIDQPVREDHKERFPRQWLYYQMKNSDGSLIGTPLEVWHKAAPEEFNDRQMAELQILKFQTVEQVATASDSQVQKVGMGAAGLRELARAFLARKNQTQNSSDLEQTRLELDELKAQMAMLMNQRKPGRPPKEA
jgi:hypothetical protein